MPLLAHALFYIGYGLVAMATGLALARFGGADAAGSALGALGLFVAFVVGHATFSSAHAAAARGGLEARLEKRLAALETAQIETRGDLAATRERLDQVAEEVSEIAQRRLEPPAPAGFDVRLLEKVLDRIGRSFEQRLEDLRRVSGPAASAETMRRNPVDLVREALRDGRVELHLQPIVSLPQRRTAFYEGFTRLRDPDGRVLLPSEFMPAAEASGQVSLIDNALLFRCVQIVRKLAKQDRRIGIFCNIAPRSLADELFFPQFLDFMHQNRDLAGALIFEIPQAAFEHRTSVDARAMARLSDLGFRFSIDKVTHLDVDLSDLERSGVKFLKASVTDVLDQIVARGVRPKSNISREISARDVTAVFRRYGIDLIAERVESEQTLAELLDLDPPYAQGHLFGAPRPIKDSLMEETQPPPDFLQRGREPGASAAG